MGERPDELTATVADPDDLWLCLVRTSKAYFTDAPSQGRLATDDWDDGFDTADLHGAERPYRVVRVSYHGPLEMVDQWKSPEKRIEEGAVWLRSRRYADEQVELRARATSLRDFVEGAQEAGADVYLPADGA
jgi:hypothetical protein